MAEQEKTGKNKTFISFHSKRRNSTNNKSCEKLNTTAPIAIISELNELINAEKFNRDDSVEGGEESSVGVSGVLKHNEDTAMLSEDMATSQGEEPRRKRSSVLTPRVHFSDDSDGFSRSSKHSSADVHQLTNLHFSSASIAAGATTVNPSSTSTTMAVRPTSLNLWGGVLNRADTPVRRISRPQHRFSYMHCDTNSKRSSSCGEQRRSSSCPALLEADAGLDHPLQITPQPQVRFKPKKDNFFSITYHSKF